jgi:hypothetical protein
LRQDLTNDASGSGASLVSMEGGPSVEDAVLDRVIRVTSIAAIKAYSAPVGYVFSLNAGGRSGVFDVIAGDFSTELAADTLNGVYVGLSDNPTATTKVAKRRFEDFASVKWFGAVGDNVSDDTAAIQAAVVYGQATGYSVYLPAGRYSIGKIDVGVSRGLINPLVLRGDGRRNTLIKANAAVANLFVYAGDQGGQSSNYNEIHDLQMSGNGIAGCAVFSLSAPHFLMSGVVATGFTEFGLFNLQYSWSCMFVGCRVFSNTGYGGRLSGECHGSSFDGVFIFGNDKWGLILENSRCNSFHGGGIEANLKGGIYASGMRSLSFFGVYFEGNGTVGDTFEHTNGSLSPVTFKTNLLLNGSSGYSKKELAAAYPCEVVYIASASRQDADEAISLVTVVACQGLTVTDVTIPAVSDGSGGFKKFSAVELYYSQNNSIIQDVKVDHAIGYEYPIKTVVGDGVYTGGGNIPVVQSGEQFNLIPDWADLIALTSPAGGPALTATDAGKTTKGKKLYKITAASTGGITKALGVRLDLSLAENSYLHGQGVYSSMLGKTFGNCTMSAYIRSYGGSTASHNGLSSSLRDQDDYGIGRSGVLTLPDSGFVEFGVMLGGITDVVTDYAELYLIAGTVLGASIKNL